jgi:hypothetical protein
MRTSAGRTLYLRAGKNHLLVKIANGGGAYAFYFRVVEMGLPGDVAGILKVASETRTEAAARRLRDYFLASHPPAPLRAARERMAAFQRELRDLRETLPRVMVMSDAGPRQLPYAAVGRAARHAGQSARLNSVWTQEPARSRPMARRCSAGGLTIRRPHIGRCMVVVMDVAPTAGGYGDARLTGISGLALSIWRISSALLIFCLAIDRSSLRMRISRGDYIGRTAETRRCFVLRLQHTLVLPGCQVVPVRDQCQVLLDFEFDKSQGGLKFFLACELGACFVVLGMGVIEGN